MPLDPTLDDFNLARYPEIEVITVRDIKVSPWYQGQAGFSAAPNVPLHGIGHQTWGPSTGGPFSPPSWQLEAALLEAIAEDPSIVEESLQEELADLDSASRVERLEQEVSDVIVAEVIEGLSVDEDGTPVRTHTGVDRHQMDAIEAWVQQKADQVLMDMNIPDHVEEEEKLSELAEQRTRTDELAIELVDRIEHASNYVEEMVVRASKLEASAVEQIWDNAYDRFQIMANQFGHSSRS
jgi:CheY-like chemotaxis protein